MKESHIVLILLFVFVSFASSSKLNKEYISKRTEKLNVLGKDLLLKFRPTTETKNVSQHGNLSYCPINPQLRKQIQQLFASETKYDVKYSSEDSIVRQRRKRRLSKRETVSLLI